VLFEAILLTGVVLAGNTRLCPLVNAINRADRPRRRIRLSFARQYADASSRVLHGLSEIGRGTHSGTGTFVIGPLIGRAQPPGFMLN
jgi:hypothetical protein